MRKLNVFLSKMQPYTYAHLDIIHQMKEESYRDGHQFMIFTTSKSTYIDIGKVIKSLGESVVVVESMWGMGEYLMRYFGDWEICFWYGEDRETSYQRLCEFLKHMCTSQKKLERSLDGISSTKAREAAAAGDFDKYISLTPADDLYEELKCL